MSKIYAAIFPRHGSSVLLMASRRLSTIHRHLAAGSAGASPGAPSMSKYRCQNGVEIATQAWGSAGSERRALALHGFLDNSSTFDLIGPALAKRGIRVVAIDFPGHGRSASKGKEGSYSVLGYVEYAMEAARWLGWNRFSIVGHSMGGAVGSVLAASFPELVDRCVSIDVIGPFAFARTSSPKLLRRNIESRRALMDKEPKVYASFDDAVKTRLKSVPQWGEGLTMTWNAAARLVAGGTEPCQEGGQVTFTHDPMLRAMNNTYLSEEAVLSYLRAIECPFLLVRGDNGLVQDTPVTFGRKAAMGDHLRDLVLPGSHHLHLDDETAPLVASHVADFLLNQDQGRSASTASSSK